MADNLVAADHKRALSPGMTGPIGRLEMEKRTANDPFFSFSLSDRPTYYDEKLALRDLRVNENLIPRGRLFLTDWSVFTAFSSSSTRQSNRHCAHEYLNETSLKTWDAHEKNRAKCGAASLTGRKYRSASRI